jgi:hypothetical protein
MKKFLFSILTCLAFAFPVLAQVASDEITDQPLTFKKGEIPAAVQKTADELFKGTPQVAWGVFPYEFKDYGWSVDKNFNGPIDHYEVQYKASDGSEIYAVFESTGELIRCRIVNKNATLPPEILKSIAASQYKDWKVAGKTEKIEESQRKIVEHYIVRLENGNMKKTLYFTSKGGMLSNK